MTENQESILDDLLAVDVEFYVDNGLASWEIDFIESLDNRRDRDLSEKQAETLERIAEKVL